MIIVSKKWDQPVNIGWCGVSSPTKSGSVPYSNDNLKQKRNMDLISENLRKDNSYSFSHCIAILLWNTPPCICHRFCGGSISSNNIWYIEWLLIFIQFLHTIWRLSTQSPLKWNSTIRHYEGCIFSTLRSVQKISLFFCRRDDELLNW